MTFYGTIHNVFYTYIISYMTFNNDTVFKKTLTIPIVGVSSFIGKILTSFIAKTYPRQIFSICLICSTSVFFLLAFYNDTSSWNIYLTASIIGFYGESAFVSYSSAMLSVINNIYSNYANGLTYTIRAPITIILFIGLSFLQTYYGYFILWITCGSIGCISFILSLYRL